MKIVAMIPARLGSKRIIKKNIRLLNDVPLIKYIIRAAKAAECFDEIYLNSESDIFAKIAEEENISFYKRPAHLSTDSATNDEFTEDFLKNTSCDGVVQLLSTSPFISPEEISNFTTKFVEENLDTLISVSNQQIECIYDDTPINFNQKKLSPPSQDLKPVQPYACGLMAWKKYGKIQVWIPRRGWKHSILYIKGFFNG